MERTKRGFTADFKMDAVRQVTEGGKKLTDVARELGVRADMLRRWRRESEGKAGMAPSDVFPGRGPQPSEGGEVRRLRRELEAAKQEIALLKKAIMFPISQQR